MLFSWIKKCLASLFSLLQFLFECTLMVLIVSYLVHLFVWLNPTIPRENTNLIGKFIGQVGSSDSTDLAEYKGSSVNHRDFELNSIQENRYSAMGYGIELKDWDTYVDQLHLIYKLSPEVVGVLRLAKYHEYGQFDPKTFFNLVDSNGEGDYLKLIVEKKNGKINFVLAGNKVNFNIAPIKRVSTQTTTFLWVFSQTKERVYFEPRYLTMAEKENMDNYFIARAVDGFVSQNGRKALEYEKEYNSAETHKLM